MSQALEYGTIMKKAQNLGSRNVWEILGTV